MDWTGYIYILKETAHILHLYIIEKGAIGLRGGINGAWGIDEGKGMGNDVNTLCCKTIKILLKRQLLIWGTKFWSYGHKQLMEVKELEFD